MNRVITRTVTDRPTLLDHQPHAPLARLLWSPFRRDVVDSKSSPTRTERASVVSVDTAVAHCTPLRFFFARERLTVALRCRFVGMNASISFSPESRNFSKGLS